MFTQRPFIFSQPRLALGRAPLARISAVRGDLNVGKEERSPRKPKPIKTSEKRDDGGESAPRPSKPRPSSRPPSFQRYSRPKPSATSTLSDGAPLSKYVRMYDLRSSIEEDPGKDSLEIHPVMLARIQKKIKAQRAIPASEVLLVRKSFDARRGKLQFVYVVDILRDTLMKAGVRRVPEDPGRIESSTRGEFGEEEGQLQPRQASQARPVRPSGAAAAAGAGRKRDPVIVVGSGPAGLFAALGAAEAGLPVILLERGQPVEVRGRDIGALMVRRQLDPESNLCYGEGGAGTWSDGKLTTRIGRNSEEVRAVLSALVRYGAPRDILVAGKPHLGTDRLVRILKQFREHLVSMGVEIRFGARVEDIVTEGSAVRGVKMSDGTVLPASAVVLAVGHSARALYHKLVGHGVAMTPKPFAMGFRVEHPQALIDRIQYGDEAASLVEAGKGPVPVADYRLAAEVPADPRDKALYDIAALDPQWADRVRAPQLMRSVFSFCMCPGGQIVPTSCSEDLLCINGMSFSRRNSKWSNSALVVGVVPNDWKEYEAHGPLAGLALQEAIERKAAAMGGGNLRVPVQRVTDFLEGRPSVEPLPSSSYRLGVTPARLDELYPEGMTAALRAALLRFDRQMPGFVSEDALLHGAETRTSAPVRVEREEEGADGGVGSLQSVSHKGLFPCGEGAGYAGGIVSAAVDGIRVGAGVVAHLLGASGGAGRERRPSAASLTY